MTNDEFIDAIKREDYNTIINCTLPMIKTIASSFTDSTNPKPLRLTYDEVFNDYLSVGTEGCWKAAKTYDKDSNTNATFLTYAKAVIRGNILTRYAEFMSGNIGYTRAKTKRANVNFGYTFSDNINDDINDKLTINPANDDTVNIFANVDTTKLLEMVDKCVKSEKQRTAIKLYYGLETGQPITLRDAAKIMGTKAENVRQLNIKAMAALQNNKDLFKRLLD
jgi:RNA polymerase sigma factor (sigma-70 family)